MIHETRYEPAAQRAPAGLAWQASVSGDNWHLCAPLTNDLSMPDFCWRWFGIYPRLWYNIMARQNRRSPRRQRFQCHMTMRRLRIGDAVKQASANKKQDDDAGRHGPTQAGWSSTGHPGRCRHRYFLLFATLGHTSHAGGACPCAGHCADRGAFLTGVVSRGPHPGRLSPALLTNPLPMAIRTFTAWVAACVLGLFIRSAWLQRDIILSFCPGHVWRADGFARGVAHGVRLVESLAFDVTLTPASRTGSCLTLRIEILHPGATHDLCVALILVQGLV